MLAKYINLVNFFSSGIFSGCGGRYALRVKSYECAVGAVFLIRLLAVLAKSINLVNFFSSRILSGCGAGLYLVDLYKVSLASRDGLFFCCARGGGMSHR